MELAFSYGLYMEWMTIIDYWIISQLFFIVNKLRLFD